MATSTSSSPVAPALFFRAEPQVPGAPPREFAVILAVEEEAYDKYIRGELLDGQDDVCFDAFEDMVRAIMRRPWPEKGVHCYPRQNPGLARYCAITDVDGLAFVINEANHFKRLAGETITLSLTAPAIEYDPPVGSGASMVLNCAGLRGNAISMIEDFAEEPDEPAADYEESPSASDLEVRAGGRVVIFRKFGDMEDDYHFYIERGDPSLLDMPGLDDYVEEFMDLVLECNGKRVLVENFMGVSNDIPQRVSPEMFRE